MEIDPVVADLATRYFNFTPTGDVIVGDARYQINHLTKTYDFIIHDCFTGGAEPIHLLSVEMFQKLKERLNPDRKSTRLNSSHVAISYAVFCLKKKTKTKIT